MGNIIDMAAAMTNERLARAREKEELSKWQKRYGFQNLRASLREVEIRLACCYLAHIHEALQLHSVPVIWSLDTWSFWLYLGYLVFGKCFLLDETLKIWSFQLYGQF